MADSKDLLDRIIEERGEKAQSQLDQKQEMERRRDRLKSLAKMNGAFQRLTREQKKRLVTSEQSLAVLDRNGQMMADCISAYDAAVSSLDSIAKRYKRNTINLTVVGKTGAGKSSFLKSASGLGNDCIPAYSGESCTGVTSIIENLDIKGTRACLTFKTEKDVLEDFNKAVAEAERKLYPDGRYGGLRADRLDRKVMEGIVNKLESPDNKVPTKELRNFPVQWDEWHPYIGQKDIIIEETAEIEKFISKHGEKDDHLYYRYIAVKKAVIQTRFHEIIDARIRLLDTVGIGDAAADTRQRMEEAIENESDGVIFIIKDSDHRFGGDLDANSQVLPRLQEIYNQQSGKGAGFWIALVLNAPEHPGLDHARRYFRLLKQGRADGGYGGDGMLGPDHIRFQQVMDVTKPGQVKDMLNAFLSQISDHLADVDARLEEKSISLCRKAMELERSLRGQAKQVSINSAAQQERNMVFDFMKSRKEKLIKSLTALEIPEEGTDLLKVRLGYLKDLEQGKNNDMLEDDESLDAIVAACCDQDILGDGYKRLAAFEKLNGVVRKVGTLCPASHRASEKAFRENAAGCMLEFLGKSPDGAIDSEIFGGEALSKGSPGFFGKLADFLFKDIDDSEDMAKAFHAMDQLQRNDVDGISKAIFNSFSFQYLNTLSAEGLKPYSGGQKREEEADDDAWAADEKEEEEGEFAFGIWGNKAREAQSSEDDSQEPGDCFKEQLKEEMRSWLKKIINKLEHLVMANEKEKFLIKGSEQIKAEVYNFLLVFGKKYDAVWLMVFQNLYEQGMILEGKGIEIKNLSEVAQITKSYLQALNS